MKDIAICYNFKFSLTIKKRKGKDYKSHTIVGVGFSYWNALWDVHYKLKNRKTEILKINSLIVLRIALAVQDEKSVAINLADHLPVIPDDLNIELHRIPK